MAVDKTDLIVVAAALIIGLFMGCLLMIVYATSAVSRAQERMQRRVRYWQAQTARAREMADQLARQLPEPDQPAQPTRRD
jgi:uncharacterized membrane-anchored protein YhcB (DUF1043 family)